jgi:DNA-damage-inducible protein D
LVETAKDVGWEVRKMMLKNSGVKPEDLSIEQDISKVKKTIKSAAKEMGKLDSPQKKISKH